MKKLIIVVIALMTYGTSSAQVDVTVNPLGILFSNFNVGIDYNVSDNISVELALGYGSNSLTNTNFKSIPVELHGKYYFNPDQGADKFYASVWLRFINRSYEWDEEFTNGLDYDYSVTRFGGGVGVGYKIVSTKGIIFDFNLGAGRAISTKEKYNDPDNQEFFNIVEWPDIMFVAKIGVGYRFGR